MSLDPDIKRVSDEFGLGARKTPFNNAGLMRIRPDGRGAAVWTTEVEPAYVGPRQVLADILEATEDIPEQFFVDDAELAKWQFLKGAKSLTRISRSTGLEYTYDEGPIPFPDPINRASRTILTGEGGAAPSRFKHLIQTEDGRYRRLTPRELERLNGFPGDWTAGMSDGKRAFMMGNALVVGLVERVAHELIQEIATPTLTAEHAEAS
jgi:DNA (cytosine-5)-methyltransferase 1